MQVPIPPQEKAAGGHLKREVSVDAAFEVITADDCIVPADDTPADLALLYTKLEEDLIQQIKVRTRAKRCGVWRSMTWTKLTLLIKPMKFTFTLIAIFAADYEHIFLPILSVIVGIFEEHLVANNVLFHNNNNIT